jgi:hypothetical protein
MKPPRKFYKAAAPPQGAVGRNTQDRVGFWENVTYLPAPPTFKRFANSQMTGVTALVGAALQQLAPPHFPPG